MRDAEIREWAIKGLKAEIEAEELQRDHAEFTMKRIESGDYSETHRARVSELLRMRKKRIAEMKKKLRILKGDKKK